MGLGDGNVPYAGHIRAEPKAESQESCPVEVIDLPKVPAVPRVHRPTVSRPEGRLAMSKP